MRWRLQNFLVELNRFFIVFTLGIQVSQIHVNITKTLKFLFDELLGLEEVLFGSDKVAGLQTESSKLVVAKTIKQIFILADYILKEFVSLLFSFGSE